jgi:tetratricopeptide (TPR) repeat protein
MLCLGLPLGIGACGKPDESKTPAPKAPSTGTVPAAPAAPSVAAVKPPPSKWSVTHQLVYHLPWPSEKIPQAELTAAVKEAEATPDQRLVSGLNDLAGWYRGQKNFGEVEKLYKRVLDLQRSRMSSEHHDVALTLNDLGVIYGESGRSAEAEESFKKALELWRKSWEMELRTEGEAVTFHNYGVMLESAGSGGEASGFEGKADAIMAARKKAFGL